MESLGEFLKKERVAKRLPLKEISRISKININYLSLLERNELDKIPDCYAKGYLDAYCDCLGLDKKQVFSRYSHQVSRLKPKDRRKQKKRLFTRKQILIVTLLGSIFITASIIICLSLSGR